MKKKRLVYMASAEIALPVLHQLVKSEIFDVVQIYTRRPKTAGRGMQEQKTPIHQAADQYKLPVATPTSFTDPSSLSFFQNLKADIVLVFAYGMILPEQLLSYLPHKFLNFHASLLPSFRGAAPIERAIEQGLAETGITLMEIAPELDAGDILNFWTTPIPKDAHALEMREKLGALAASNVLSALTTFFEGSYTPLPQNHTLATYAPKLSKKESPIDFSYPAQTIVNKCRAFHPFPVCTANIAEKTIKIWQAEIHKDPTDAPIGTIVDHKNFVVACGEKSAIKLITVQRAGKKITSGKNFLQQFNPLPQKMS